MSNEIQKFVDEQQIAEANANALIEAFGAPFTEAGKILRSYKKIKVTEEDQTDLMKKAKSQRLTLKKIRTGVENRRKELKEDSLKTGRAIDAVARYIRDQIEPAEKYLEDQEKYAERMEAERRSKLISERSERLRPYVDSLAHYQLDTYTEEGFEKLFNELKAAHELRLAQEKAYEEQQAKEAAEREAENQRIREDNEKLRKQAEAREAEIAREREQDQEAHEAEVRAAKEAAESALVTKMKAKINELPRYTINGGSDDQMISYSAVIELIEKNL